MEPWTGTSWWLEISHLTLNDAVVTSTSTPSVTVTYDLTHDGVAAGSGAMTYDTSRKMWRTAITLPDTAGVLAIAYTATAGTEVGRAYDAIRVRKGA